MQKDTQPNQTCPGGYTFLFLCVAIYFPPPRTANEAADTIRFYIDGTGFVDFCEKFKYLGSILRYSLTCDVAVDKRIASPTAALAP